MLDFIGPRYRDGDGVSRRGFLRLTLAGHLRGMDHTDEFFDAAKRPLPILAEGKPITELVG